MRKNRFLKKIKSRAVTICLSAAMVITTLTGSTSDLTMIHAEEDGGGSGEVAPEEKTIFRYNIDGAVDESATVVADTNTVYFEAKNTSIKLFGHGDANLELTVAVDEDAERKLFDSELTTSKIEYRIIKCTSEPEDYISYSYMEELQPPDVYENGDKIEITTDNLTTNIALYARPKFDLENEDVKELLKQKLNLVDVEFDEDNQSKYSLQAIYSYDGSSLATAIERAKWLDSSSSVVSDDGYVAAATLSCNLPEGKLPTIKYAIRPYNGDSDSNKPESQWGDDNSLASLQDGKYIGFIGVFSANDKEVLCSEPLRVNKDENAPTYTVDIFEGTPDESGGYSKVGESLYHASNNEIAGVISFKHKLTDSTNKLVLKVSADDGAGSGVKEIYINDVMTSAAEAYCVLGEGANTSIKIKVLDKMNYGTEENQFNVLNDNVAPSIEKITIDEDVYDPNNVKQVGDFVLKVSGITDAMSGVDFTSVVVNFFKDGDTAVTPVTYYLQGDKTNAAISFKFSEIAENTDFKGNYAIVVTVSDKVGNNGSIKWENIYIDNTAPACDSLLVEYRARGSEDEWKTLGSYDYNSSNSSNGNFISANFVINPYKYYEYRYTVIDEKNDITSVYFEDSCASCEEDKKTSTIAAPDPFTDTFYYNEAGYDVSHTNRSLKITLTNKVGTKKTINVPYTFVLDSMDISGSSILDDEGKAVSSIPANTNRKHSVLVKAVSSHKIKSVRIVVEKEDGTLISYGPQYEVVDDAEKCKFDASTGLFNVNEITLNIPTDMGKNILMKNSYVEIVEDNYDASGNPIVKKIPLGTLLYDMSKPQMESVNIIVNGNSKETFDSDKWYRSAEFNYVINAGFFDAEDMSKVESELSYVGYEMFADIDSGYGENNQYAEGLKEVYKGKINKVSESQNIGGTVLVFNATDKAYNHMEQKTYVVKVDATKPYVSFVDIAEKTDKNTYTDIPKMQTLVGDNISLSRIAVDVTYPDGEVLSFDLDGVSTLEKDIEKIFNIPNFAQEKALIDGKYTVEVHAFDLAGNESSATSNKAEFIIDKTLPNVTAKIVSGDMGGKNPTTNFDGSIRDKYYSSNVGLQFTCDDNNVEASGLVVTDNGRNVSISWQYDDTINKLVGNYTSTGEGKHDVAVYAVDNAGNKSATKTISFVKDTVAPMISTQIGNNYSYSEGSGKLYFTSDVVVNTSVEDSNIDENDFYYRVDRRLANTSFSAPVYMKSRNLSFGFSEEADYVVDFYCIDQAGNKSETRTVEFRIDKTFPEINIGGIGEDGKASTAVNVVLSLKESFYSDANGKAVIYKKAGDGVRETLLKTIDIKPTGVITLTNETFAETGIYRIEMEASDRVGHRATLSRNFIIDTKAPMIKLTGVNNYDKTTENVTIYSEISDEFYLNKKVRVVGKRVDIDGMSHNIDFGGYNVMGNPTVINKQFEEDGIYDIEISSTDMVGNTTTNRVHFTIDKTNPEILDIPIKDGSSVNSVDLSFDEEKLVKDLTVCEVNKYLNGSEYDGNNELEDGSYKLTIKAKDELNHTSEKTVAFVYDTKPPVFVVEGVEKNQVKEGKFDIKVSVQYDDDILQSVAINGKEIEVKNNVASLQVNDEGTYELTMNARDNAGNIATDTYKFAIGNADEIVLEEQEDESGYNLPAIIIMLVLLAGVITLIVVKTKKTRV